MPRRRRSEEQAISLADRHFVESGPDVESQRVLDCVLATAQVSRLCLLVSPRQVDLQEIPRRNHPAWCSCQPTSYRIGLIRCE